MTNKYKTWSLLHGYAGKILVEKLEDTDEGLIIYLNFPSDSINHGESVEVLFDSYIAYRNMNESYRAKTFSNVGGFKGSFYIVNSSSWLKWLHDESMGFYTSSEILHYSIITEADCIDILSEFPPEVSWNKK